MRDTLVALIGSVFAARLLIGCAFDKDGGINVKVEEMTLYKINNKQITSKNYITHQKWVEKYHQQKNHLLQATHQMLVPVLTIY